MVRKRNPALGLETEFKADDPGIPITCRTTDSALPFSHVVAFPLNSLFHEKKVLELRVRERF